MPCVAQSHPLCRTAGGKVHVGSYTAAAIEPIAAPLDAAFLFLDAAGIGQRFTSQLLQQLCSSHKLDWG